ncbi:MAG: response regulator [Candidatus Hydrogenedentes bacterium]|nr:response regulator [Candidatus Hydrogenedentota bacterium]MCC6695747.1 response regulator [Candidatus Hydrogenedentota bacterium]
MHKPRLLVVDDEEHIRFALHRWFEACGFDVDLAEDGDVAVGKCEKTAYDVITMDLVMPRMDGVAAISAIRDLQPQVPILVFTGYHDRVEEALETGATRTLAKPLTLHELEKEVRSLLVDRQHLRA